MEDSMLIAQQYDTCERVWKRVAPELAPYAGASLQEESAAKSEDLLALPGAEANPCCMGTQAQLAIDVLKGFLHEELANKHRYEVLSRRVGALQARRLFCRLAAEKERHAQKLAAALYLITGEHCRVKFYPAPVPLRPYCEQLRELYHEEACGGFNYARAAQETNDLCLKELLTAFSDDEYRHARCILDLLSYAVK